MFGVTAMITLVFIICRLAELLQNSNRNPGRLSKVATTSGPRCGDVSGPVMALRFCSPYWWWKRHWLMQIVFVLWLLKRYCGLSRSKNIWQVIGKLQLFTSGQLLSEYCTARCFFHACAIMYIIQLGLPMGKMRRVLYFDRLPEPLYAWDITLLSRVR